jgi:multiple sugar transport system ATP-binding protein
LFVAGFIGSPAMNFTAARLDRDGGAIVAFAGHKLNVPAEVAARHGLDRYFGRDIILGIRPSDFEDAGLAEPDWPRMPVDVSVTEELGSEIHVIFTIDAAPVQHASITQAREGGEDEEAIPLGANKTQWTARVASRSPIKPGSSATLAVDTANLQFFDADSGLAIGRSAS